MALTDYDYAPASFRDRGRFATRESLGLRALDERTNPSGFVVEQHDESCLDDPFFEDDGDDVSIGTCSTCGGYGTPGRECRKPTCLELGGTFC